MDNCASRTTSGGLIQECKYLFNKRFRCASRQFETQVKVQVHYSPNCTPALARVVESWRHFCQARFSVAQWIKLRNDGEVIVQNILPDITSCPNCIQRFAELYYCHVQCASEHMERIGCPGGGGRCTTSWHTNNHPYSPRIMIHYNARRNLLSPEEKRYHWKLDRKPVGCEEGQKDNEWWISSFSGNIPPTLSSQLGHIIQLCRKIRPCVAFPGGTHIKTAASRPISALNGTNGTIPLINPSWKKGQCMCRWGRV